MNEDDPATVTFEALDADGTSGYQVSEGDRDVGVVRPFRLGAGQFGSGWAAETPDGEQSTGFPDRDAAADWLITRAPR